MAISDGTNICETCRRRFWPERDKQRFACPYCGVFPEQVKRVQEDWLRHPWTRLTRQLPIYDDTQCTCPREST